MKNYKNLLSLLLLLLCTSSCLIIDGKFGYMDGVFIVVVAGIVWGLIPTKKERERKVRRAEAEEREREAQREKWQHYMQEVENKHKQYEQDCQSLAEKYGEADKTFVLVKDDINREIRAYSHIRKVFILGKEYDFSSILQCSVSDDSHIEKGETTIRTTGTSSGNNGNTIGRAVVGGLVAGGAGAIIGGSTSKRNMETTSVVSQGEDVLHHNCTVWISVKDIANPMIQIPVGEDVTKANEIAALMNAIIAS